MQTIEERQIYNKAYSKAYYERNKEQCAATHHLYYEKHKAQICQRMKSWYNNGGKHVVSQYRQKHKKRLNTKMQEWRKRNPDRQKALRCKSFSSFLTMCIWTAKVSKVAKTKGFDITKDYLLMLLKKQNNKCAISEINLIHDIGKPETVSIDRIDSSKGYIKGNVQLVCQFINYAKHDYSQEECKRLVAEIRKAN